MKKYEVFITQKMIDEGMENSWGKSQTIGLKALQTLEELKNQPIEWRNRIGEVNGMLLKCINDNGDLVEVLSITEPQKVYFQEITKKEFNFILFGW